MSEADAPSDFHKTITDLGGAALANRLRFVTEIDKLKGILRQTPLLDRLGAHVRHVLLPRPRQAEQVRLGVAVVAAACRAPEALRGGL